MKICKNDKCEKEHEGSIGAGDFCSQACANRRLDDKTETKEAFCIACGAAIQINKRASIKHAKCSACAVSCVSSAPKKRKSYNTANPLSLLTTADNVCDYGCEQVAHYVMTNGKMCCSMHWNSCPALKKRNALGVHKAFKDGKIQGFSKKARDASFKAREETLRNEPFHTWTLARIKAFVMEEQQYRCLVCGLDLWMGKPIPLELDHIDGDRHDNRRENVRCLCVNCHAQTPTWKRGANFNKKHIAKHGVDVIIKVLQESKTMDAAMKTLYLQGGSYYRVKQIISDYDVIVGCAMGK